MGFFDNLGNEFGKKTGKAIGNKLYGKHADDIRVASRSDINANINSQRSVSSTKQNEDALDYEAIEKAKRKTLRLEQDTKVLNDIINVEFNPLDKDDIIKNLTMLSANVDTMLKESNKNKAAAKSKFEAGLAMLSSIDPQNPMISYFVGKRSEWCAFEERRKKRQLIIVVVIAVVILVLVILIAMHG